MTFHELGEIKRKMREGETREFRGDELRELLDLFTVPAGNFLLATSHSMECLGDHPAIANSPRRETCTVAHAVKHGEGLCWWYE